MMYHLLSQIRYSRFAPIYAGILGAIFPFSLSPYHIWPLALVCIGLFADVLYKQTTKQALVRGWSFGIGLWGVGVSWLFISIHEYLGDHFIVKYKIITVVGKINGTNNICVKCTVPCVIFAKLLPKHYVFK